jgi:putative FmdB family regulatory protein
MPIYEYRCSGCAAEFERYVATAAAAVVCPTCASGEVKRKLSVVRFKSGGEVMSTVPSSGGGGCCGGGCACH